MNVVAAQRRRVGIITCAAGYVRIPGICFAFTFFHQLQVAGLSHHIHRRYLLYIYRGSRATPRLRLTLPENIESPWYCTMSVAPVRTRRLRFLYILEGGDSVATFWASSIRDGTNAGRQRVSVFAGTSWKLLEKRDPFINDHFDREMDSGKPVSVYVENVRLEMPLSALDHSDTYALSVVPRKHATSAQY
jgi:hypothetical protein